MLKKTIARLASKILKRKSTIISDRFFVFLFNLRAKCLNAHHYIKKEGDIFCLYDGSDHLYFAHKPRGYLSYINGVVARGCRIGKDYILDKIEFNNGDVIVDCGANIGDLKLYFNQEGIDIDYLGIEPSPIEFGCLAKNVYPSQCLNVALWHEEGELDFYLASEGADSSLISPGRDTPSVKVSAVRLDNILNHYDAVKLLKIEAEGAEPEVLRGAVSILKSVEYVAVDAGPERGLEQATTDVAVVNFLYENGFRIVGMNHDRIVILFANNNLVPATGQNLP